MQELLSFEVVMGERIGLPNLGELAREIRLTLAGKG